MEDIRKTGAEIVVTGCLGCLIQLRQGIYNHHLKAEAKHIVEVIDKGL